MIQRDLTIHQSKHLSLFERRGSHFIVDDKRGGRPARSARPKSSSPCLAPPATPSPKPPGRRNCPTGWVRMLDVLLFSVGLRRSWCPTFCAAASPRGIATNLISTPAIATWPSITAWPCFLLARASLGTKPRSKSACKWSSAGSSRCCAIASFSRWANSIRRSAYYWIASTSGPSKSCPAHVAQPSKATNRRCNRSGTYVYAEWKKGAGTHRLPRRVDGHFSG
ncbi:hypothetical protein PS710_03246 [Pseudomonas fluorescens]|uniref:Uncharacterized protein n=1 Tax=Pseudomonas fluorescens TaxID=294 RepID=A0A5E7CUQ5_PSEFL|nr:hypothetical protein PS710_03246 [Pseudomonas fluorescens]